MASLMLTCSGLYAQVSNTVVVVAPDPTALVGTSSGAFTLIRYGPTNHDLSVNVKLSGSASNGVDYLTIPNSITIPAGALATDVKVDPIVDQANRGNKTVYMTVETNANYHVGEHRTAAVSLIDDSFDFALPSITISSPTNNSIFTNPPWIKITVNISDPGVNIKSVSFYANDEFLGRVTASPFSLVWSNPPSGHFSLFARAVDAFDRSALSAPVHITVNDLDPVVEITSPTNGQNFVVHDNITLKANASDPDPSATVASVSFFANDHLLGTSKTAPYSLVWSNAPSGFFFLRAVATDSTGDKGYSAPVLINVSPFTPKILSISR